MSGTSNIGRYVMTSYYPPLPTEEEGDNCFWWGSHWNANIMNGWLDWNQIKKDTLLRHDDDLMS